jgi:hypothetical protein
MKNVREGNKKRKKKRPKSKQKTPFESVKHTVESPKKKKHET